METNLNRKPILTEALESLQERLGHAFGDRSILIQSLTHTSYGHEHLQEKNPAHRDNERLEFLGDAILDVILSDILLETYPQANEGQLSKMRAAVVNEKTLAEIALNLRIPNCIRLGKGELQTGGESKASILSGTFEALIAAVYLDGGFYAVYPVVRHLFNPFFTDEKAAFVSSHDPKTQLQEKVQAKWKVTPTYHLCKTTGPEHAKTFEVEVRIVDQTLARAEGPSKKQAEQNAARNALASFLSQEGTT